MLALWSCVNCCAYDSVGCVVICVMSWLVYCSLLFCVYVALSCGISCVLVVCLFCFFFFFLAFFFFQAEDGIRDVAVTGVQTCALPICLSDRWCNRQGDVARCV